MIVAFGLVHVFVVLGYVIRSGGTWVEDFVCCIGFGLWQSVWGEVGLLMCFDFVCLWVWLRWL